MLNTTSQAGLYPPCLVRLYRQAMTLGARIRQLREHFGLTQDEFGELCEVGKSAVSQWESNSTLPEVASLLMLRARRAFSLDWLLTGVGDMLNAMPLDLPRQKLLQVSQQLPDYAIDRLSQEGTAIAELIEQASKPKAASGGG